MVNLDRFKKFVKPAAYDSSKDMPAICTECAQERPVCCQNLPCSISPNDLKDLSYQGIISFIDDTGIVSIDWWDGGDSRTSYKELIPPGKYYFLRMKAKRRKIIDPGFGMQTCSIWNENIGCPLNFEYRPKGARDLIPKRKGLCDEEYPKDMCAFEWLPYQDILKKVVEHYEVINESSTFIESLISSLIEMEELIDLAYEKE